MSFKDYIKSVRERWTYAKMVIEGIDNLWSFEQTVHALRHDGGSLTPGSLKDPSLEHHYKFGTQGMNDPMDMKADQLNDFAVSKIGAALKKSKKATAITLRHGVVTDKGMTAFLKGLDATEAPIKALHLDDLPAVSDKSLSILPKIIEKKGIVLCEIGYCHISPDLKKHINLACSKNQKVTPKDKNLSNS